MLDSVDTLECDMLVEPLVGMLDWLPVAVKEKSRALYNELLQVGTELWVVDSATNTVVLFNFRRKMNGSKTLK